MRTPCGTSRDLNMYKDPDNFANIQNIRPYVVK